MIFLIILGLIWLVFAVVCDWKKREVPDWLNFSLLGFALSYRAFYSIFLWDARFFLFGLAGAGIFFILANLFYYSRIFAGGDAKLLIAFGALLPFADSLESNLFILIGFIFLLLFSGAIYGTIFSFFLIMKNRKGFSVELRKQFGKMKKIILISEIFIFCIFLFFVFFNYKILSFLAVIVFIYPFLFVYAKAVDEGCLIKKISVSELSEGDWIAKKMKIGKKIIKPSFMGITKKEVELIKKKYKDKKILIKQGIPFVPVFLISFLILIYIWNRRLFF